MKKHKLVVLGAFAALMMMAMTACSSKPAETTAAPTTVAETTTTEETTTVEETTEEETETTAAETLSEKVGTLGAGGKFLAANGKFEITLPEGWTVDSSSDEKFTTFISKDGNDYAEVQFETGDVEGLVEELPDTMEEYKSWVIRSDEKAEFTNYNVENTGSGQNYQYAIKYTAEDADPKFMSVNSSYDSNAKEFLIATAVVQSDSEEAVKAVEDMMSSYKILK